MEAEKLFCLFRRGTFSLNQLSYYTMESIAQDVIHNAVKGDKDAFEQIYRHYGSFVYSVALRMCQNEPDAEEVTQDVFILLYRKLRSYRFDSAFSTWLYRIAVNVTLNYLKKHKRLRMKAAEYEIEQDVTVSPAREIEYQIDAEYREKKIQEILMTLNPDQRMCFILRTVEEMPYEEIAVTLGINVNTVKSRIKRAREHLMALRTEVMTHEL